jgi:RimJ/RimL family protein N-acetyltransferase
VVDAESGEPAGWVGYWERTVGDGTVFEIGWSVLPAFQGRGLASAATAQALDRARAERVHRYVHAYPSVENGPSNAICRKLGFALVEQQSYEYPPRSGNVMVCNDWRFDLFAES